MSSANNVEMKTGRAAARKQNVQIARMNTPERPLHDYVADISEHTEVRRGVPLPFGTSESEGGVNFSFFSRHASRVRLELFDQPADATPSRVIDFDPARNRTGDVWHVWVEGIHPGQRLRCKVPSASLIRHRHVSKKDREVEKN